MVTSASNGVYKLQVAAFIIFCIGQGWNGAIFSPVGDVPNTFAHLIPVLLLLLIFGVQFFTEHDAQQRGAATTHWGQIGITVLAVITIIGDIVLITLGQTNPDPNSVGVHDFTDWVPATLTLLGSSLWLAAQIAGRGRKVATALEGYGYVRANHPIAADDQASARIPHCPDPQRHHRPFCEGEQWAALSTTRQAGAAGTDCGLRGEQGGAWQWPTGAQLCDHRGGAQALARVDDGYQLQPR